MNGDHPVSHVLTHSFPTRRSSDLNAKAKNVIALSEILVRDFGGEVPADRDTLVELPGVGRKTANVVMNSAFGAETFAVDTHIFRVDRERDRKSTRLNSSH